MTAIPQTSGLFETLLTAPTILRNKEVLRSSHVPGEIRFRDTPRIALATNLLPLLNGARARNILVTGPEGSGKTALVRHVCSELSRVAQERDAPVSVIYIDGALFDTEYRVLSTIANSLNRDYETRVPFTGWNTNEVVDALVNWIGLTPGGILIVLDNADRLVAKNGASTLESLVAVFSRLTDRHLNLVTIGRSSDFLDYAAPHTKISLTEEVVALSTYPHHEVVQLMRDRAELAFTQPEKVPNAVYDHLALVSEGNASRALDLLRIAAETAQWDRNSALTIEHVHAAMRRMVQQRTSEAVKELSSQTKLLLYALTLAEDETNTGAVYDRYERLARLGGVEVLTQRRVTDLITELHEAGLATATVKSLGRYGRTKVIRLLAPRDYTRSLLQEDALVQNASQASFTA